MQSGQSLSSLNKDKYINSNNDVHNSNFNISNNINDDALVAVLSAARRCGVHAMFVPASSLSDCDVHLPRSLSNVSIFRSAGVHPFEAKSAPYADDLLKLNRLLLGMDDLSLPNFLAVGECGLDSTPGFPPLDPQVAWFQAQVELARKIKLPLFCHERGCHDEFMRILNPHIGHVKIMVHCFTGSAAELQAYNQAGMYISVSGLVCRKGKAGDQLRQALKQHPPPLDRLTIETDAPYMGFPNCRPDGKQTPNVPTALPLVLKGLSEVLGISEHQLAQSSTSTACNFFNVDETTVITPSQ